MTMPVKKIGTNIRDFPHTPLESENQNHQKQQYENNQAEASSTCSSSSTTTVPKPPFFDKETRQSLHMESLKTLFFDTFSREMPRAIATTVLADLRAGTPHQYYEYAMEQTLMAPRPSWRYTLAIVARLKRTACEPWEMDYR